MRILVTGGAGFIGSNYVEWLMGDKENEVIVVDALTYAGSKGYLSPWMDRDDFHFYPYYVEDERRMEEVFRKHKPQHVVHFAAETHVDNSIKKPIRFIESNVQGTFTMLEVSRMFEVERFVYISTDEVYGSIMDGSFKETDMTYPRNPYSATKLAGEALVRSYCNTYAFPGLITRSSNNFGLRQAPEKFIPKSIGHLLRGEPILIYGSGEQVRDWLWVTDNCSAIDDVRIKGMLNNIYNIGANNEWSNIEIAQLLIEIMGKPKSMLVHGNDRPGHDFRYSLDTTKIRTELEWQPFVTDKNSFKVTFEWVVKQYVRILSK